MYVRFTWQLKINKTLPKDFLTILFSSGYKCIILPSRCAFSPTYLNYSKSKHINKEYGIQNESNKLLIFSLQENLSHIAAHLASTHVTHCALFSISHGNRL